MIAPTLHNQVAAFLKLRDEKVGPDEADEQERAASASAIMDLLTGGSATPFGVVAPANAMRNAVIQPQASKHTALLPVRVKAISWSEPVQHGPARVTGDRGGVCIKGFTPFYGVTYTVQSFDGDKTFVPLGNIPAGTLSQSFATIDEAKAEAQRWFDVLALSAIEPDPSSSAQEVRAARASLDGITLQVATALVELFGSDDTDMTIQFIADGHSGPGFYAWCTEYPEDGSDFLGPDFDTSEAARLASAPPVRTNAEGDNG